MKVWIQQSCEATPVPVYVTRAPRLGLEQWIIWHVTESSGKRKEEEVSLPPLEYVMWGCWERERQAEITSAKEGLKN